MSESGFAGYRHDAGARSRSVVILALAAATAGVSACGQDAWTRYEERAAAIKELSQVNAGVDSEAYLASVSATQLVHVAPLGSVELTDHADSVDYHRFMHRCGACHTAPDPSLHTATEWPDVIQRMKATMRKAGLLPMDTSDESAVLDFVLRRSKR